MLPAATAQAASPWGGGWALTSAYVFRGVAQSGHDGALQADLHWRDASGWFAGAWASSIAPASGSFGRSELDLYGGFGWLLDERWQASLRFARYTYPASPLGQRYDSDELAVSVELDDVLVLSLAASPDTSRYGSQGWELRRHTLAWEASWRQPLGTGPLAVTASAGYYDTRSLFGSAYRAWSAGLALKLGPVDLTLQRFGTDGAAHRLFGDDGAQGRWVVGSAWRF